MHIYAYILEQRKVSSGGSSVNVEEFQQDFSDLMVLQTECEANVLHVTITQSQ